MITAGILKRYEEVIKEVGTVVAMSCEGINENLDKLRALEQSKYALSYVMVSYEHELVVKKAQSLQRLLTENDALIKKAFSSSTLTGIILDGEVAETLLRYRILQELLRNVRGSIDATRSILSAEKSLAEL